MKRILLGLGVCVSVTCLFLAVFVAFTVLRVLMSPEDCVRCSGAWTTQPMDQLARVLALEATLLVIPALTLWGWLANRNPPRRPVQSPAPGVGVSRMRIALLTMGVATLGVGAYQAVEALQTGTLEGLRGNSVAVDENPLAFWMQFGLWGVLMPLYGLLFLWLGLKVRRDRKAEADHAAFERSMAQRAELDVAIRRPWNGGR